MPPIRWVYLALTIVGTILPWMYFASWFNANGWSLPGMVEAWNVNDAATGLVYDLTVSYAALVIWSTYENIVERRWLALVLVPVAGISVGVSCALPLFLFLRSAPRPGA